MTMAGDTLARQRPAAVPPPSRGGARLGRQRALAARLPGVAVVAAALEARRLLILIPFAAIAGVVLAIPGGVAPDAWLLGLLGVALALAVLLAWRWIIALRLVALAGAVWLGLVLPQLHGALFGTAMLERAVFGTYEMQVDEILSETDGVRRVIVSDIASERRYGAIEVRRARVVVEEGEPFEAGDRLAGKIRFYPVPGAVLPGGFDTQLHAWFDGIGAYGAATEPVRRVATGDPAAPERVVEFVRRALAARIDSALQQPAAGIARALVTGDQSNIEDAARTSMAAAGLAHVLAISGLHLSLVAGGVFIVLRMLLAPWVRLGGVVSTKRIAAAGGIIAALAYYAISGGSVAATRATIMIVLVFGAVIVGRRALTMRNVALAALIVIASDPVSVLRPSFQLSFSAVIALIGAWELTRQREPRERARLPGALAYLFGIVSTSFIAGAATLLFTMYHFQQTAPLGILGNLFAMPLVAFVTMPAAVVGALMTPLGLEWPFFWVMGWSIDQVLGMAALVAEWSRPLEASPLLTPLALILGLAALAWFALLPNWPRLLGPLLLVPGVALFGLDRPPDVVVSDTTQAVAVRMDGELALVAGRSNSFAVDVWRETYRDPILPVPVTCDDGSCLARSTLGFTVAIVREATGVERACATADLVVSRQLMLPPDCAAQVRLDAEALARGGAHWLGWDARDGRFDVRRTREDAVRPWRPAAVR